MSDRTRNIVMTLALSAVWLTLGSSAARAELLGIDWDTGKVYRVSTLDASLTVVDNNFSLPGLASLEYYNGAHYGYTTQTIGQPPTDGRLYRLDVAGNVVTATQIGSGLNLSSLYEGGLAFSPNGTAWAANQGGAISTGLFTIDMATGLAQFQGNVGGGVHDFNGLAWYNGNLIALDRVSNRLIEINPANLANPVVKRTFTSITVGSVGGMVLLGDTLYFSTSGPSSSVPGSNSLYALNVNDLNDTSIQPQLIGKLNIDGTPLAGTGISGLAIVPEPGTCGLLGLGAMSLLGWRRRSRKG